MIKKTMLAACLAALAFAALPALASATETSNPGGPYIKDGTTTIKNTPFTVAGGEGELNTVGGNFVNCESVTGSGEFTDSETGTISFAFHGCRTIFGITCTTPGDPSGTITAGPFTFHMKTVDHEGAHSPGVLITPKAGEEYAEFNCSFAGNIKVKGNGIIGTITSPAENTPSNTATIKFQQSSAGHQTHKTITNDSTSYHLNSSFNEGAFEESGETATGTITFAEGMKPEIKTTPTE
jgi:hypothetical protein